MAAELIRIADRLDSIHREQVRQGTILEHHERRSTNLEARVIPLEVHVQRWAGVGKALAILGMLASILAAGLKLIG